ncbi:hypothetical protein [Streptomyces sp. TS71-3]|uniref:hypothetical protein n=1 Tax=Streptomyces sp. TS71-3 TaxID=2733862 RepID=UPI001B195397|nr:hypothetical protein [Streptomyces sp. TS71-3]GHJ35457.1 hypothetical protein Sm713_10660 [Streptomyces sp. TS71-3]
MTHSDARRTTFSFAPPVDDAGAWSLNLEDFANRLLQSFPGGSATPEGGMGPRDADTLSFEIPLGGGTWLEGLATTPYPGVGSVTAITASAQEAAVLARWLRDTLAPAPDLIFFTTEPALESGDTDYQQIPAHSDVPEIAHMLQEHIDAHA